MADLKTAPERLGKTPNETVKKDMDFGNPDLASGETVDTVSSVTITPVTVPALTNGGTAISSPKVQITLSGGLAGNTYKIVIKVTTSLGQTLEGAGFMPCLDA